jgi:hypothetical protein
VAFPLSKGQEVKPIPQSLLPSSTPPKAPPKILDSPEPEITDETIPYILNTLNGAIEDLFQDPPEKEMMLQSIESLNDTFLKDQKNPALIKKLFSLATALEKKDPKMTAIYQSIAVEFPKENFVKTLKNLVFKAPKCDSNP